MPSRLLCLSYLKRMTLIVGLEGDTLAGKFGGHCIDSLRYLIVIESINTATDFILLALPIPLLWKLRTSKLQKIVLTIIFTVGLT